MKILSDTAMKHIMVGKRDMDDIGGTTKNQVFRESKSWTVVLDSLHDTAQKMKFSIKDFFSKSDQIRRKLVIWSYLLKKPLMENFIFCAVWDASIDVGILFPIH